MPVNPREIRRKPDHERRKLQRQLDQQTAKLKEFGRDKTIAEETVEEWKANAQDRIEVICDLAFPMDTPSDPTTAALILGRIQGFLEPLRKAYDTLGLTGQMQANADKIRDAINDLGEEVYDDDEN